MDDARERDLLKEINRLQRGIDADKDPKIKSPEDYIADMRMYGDIPKDQFAHQFKLLWHPQSEPKTQMDLLPPDALLGLVKDSKSLLFLQNDNALINRFFDMGLRDSGVMELFNSLFYSWWQQMRMTGILGGNERWLQSFLEPDSQPYESFSFLEKRKAKKKAMAQNFGLGDLANRIQTNQRGRKYI